MARSYLSTLARCMLFHDAHIRSLAHLAQEIGKVHRGNVLWDKPTHRVAAESWRCLGGPFDSERQERRSILTRNGDFRYRFAETGRPTGVSELGKRGADFPSRSWEGLVTFMGIRMIQLDTRCKNMYLDTYRDVNPLYFGERRCNATARCKHSAHLNVNPFRTATFIPTCE